MQLQLCVSARQPHLANQSKDLLPHRAAGLLAGRLPFRGEFQGRFGVNRGQAQL